MYLLNINLLQVMMALLWELDFLTGKEVIASTNEQE
jgi:hypothetical protein